MRSNYKRLGGYIRPVDERNYDRALGEDNLYGISVTKEFIISHANLVGVSFDGYKVVSPRQFAYIPDTSRRGDKIAISLNTFGEKIIVSSICSVFEIIDENALLPEYLMLWFMRPEFDRYARFMSNGSAREVFEWECMCGVELPIPCIDDQRKIVRDYEVITRRIDLLRKIDENLEKQALIYFHSTVDNLEKNNVLSDFACITMGTSPEGETLNDKADGEVFYQGRSDFGFRFPSIRLYTSNTIRRAKQRDVLMSVRAPVGDINIAKEDCAIGRGLAAIHPKDNCYSFLYYTMKELYYELKRFNDEGTVFGSITKDDLAALKIQLPSPSDRENFESKVRPIDNFILNNEFEIISLQALRSNLLSGITKGI
ncbi:restriction endonuclease subunit S [Aristaeella hokkaidonensis]|nr:restriction endonuclease subunit S [Aristaeella hokkaidonensis]SNT94447.1 Type I restriction modification DNA specificity domain-containing protein [Aristaeella hokkaidonensis]